MLYKPLQKLHFLMPKFMNMYCLKPKAIIFCYQHLFIFPLIEKRKKIICNSIKSKTIFIDFLVYTCLHFCSFKCSKKSFLAFATKINHYILYCPKFFLHPLKNSFIIYLYTYLCRESLDQVA